MRRTPPVTTYARTQSYSGKEKPGGRELLHGDDVDLGELGEVGARPLAHHLEIEQGTRLAADAGPLVGRDLPDVRREEFLATGGLGAEGGGGSYVYLEPVVVLDAPGDDRRRIGAGDITVEREGDRDVAGITTFGVTVRVCLRRIGHGRTVVQRV